MAWRGRSSVGVRLWDPRIPLPNTCVCVRVHTASSPTQLRLHSRETPMVTGAPKDLCRLALAGGALLALACGHTEPFSIPPYGTSQPFDPTPPVRLTLNDGPDRDRLVAARRLGHPLLRRSSSSRHDFDVCLAELPPDGGTQRRLVCDLAAGDDTDERLRARRSRDRTAGWRSSGSAGRFSSRTIPRRPIDEALSVAPGLDAAERRRGSTAALPVARRAAAQRALAAPAGWGPTR